MKLTKPRSSLWVQLTFWLLCGLMLLGMRDTLVGRDEIMLGAPRSLLGWSIALTLIGVAANALRARSSTPKRSHLMFWDACYFVAGTLLMSGNLMLINGALDFGPLQTHRTTLLDKKAVAGRYGVTYYLVTRDWRDARDTVQLEVGRDVHLRFESSSGRQIGDPIEVTTSKGLLGFERFRGAK